NKLIHWQNSIFFRQCAALLLIAYGVYTAYDAIKLMVNLG
ncbi:sulfite exporter TauE/SafE family protein, partial [Vibrio mimicus]